MHKDSDEAQRQIARQEGVGISSGEESGAEEGEREEDIPADEKSAGGEKRLRNQFNFSERASQTLNNPYRVGCTYLYYLTRVCP